MTNAQLNPPHAGKSIRHHLKAGNIFRTAALVTALTLMPLYPSMPAFLAKEKPKSEQKKPIDLYAQTWACNTFKRFQTYIATEDPFHPSKEAIALYDALRQAAKNPAFHSALLDEFQYYQIFQSFEGIERKLGPGWYAVSFVFTCKSYLATTYMGPKLHADFMRERISGKIENSDAGSFIHDKFQYIGIREKFESLPNSIERNAIVKKANLYLKGIGATGRIDTDFFKLIKIWELHKIAGITGLTREETGNVLDYLTKTNVLSNRVPSSYINLYINTPRQVHQDSTWKAQLAQYYFEPCFIIEIERAFRYACRQLIQYVCHA